MPIRRSSMILGVVGVLLAIAALLVRLVAAPLLTRLPSDLDLTLHYTGTANLLNAKALDSGDLPHLFIEDAPTTIDRHIKAERTTAHTAIVTDETQLGAAGTTSTQSHTYALDRTTLRTVTAAAGTAVEPSTGCLTIAFPQHPKAGDTYSVYDNWTQRCFPVRYLGASNRAGRSVYEYQATLTGPVQDQALLRTLPPALPMQTLAALAAQLPATARAQLSGSEGLLPDPVPLAYTAATKLHVWVDRETGLPIDETLHQEVGVGVDIAGQRVDLMPVLDLSAAFTPHTVTSNAAKAGSAGTKLLLIQVVIPAVLAGLGLLLIVVAVLRRRRPLPAQHDGAAVAPAPIPTLTP